MKDIQEGPAKKPHLSRAKTRKIDRGNKKQRLRSKIHKIVLLVSNIQHPHYSFDLLFLVFHQKKIKNEVDSRQPYLYPTQYTIKFVSFSLSHKSQAGLTFRAVD